MQNQPPYVDDVPEKGITIRTLVGGGNVETSVQESGSIGVKDGESGPTHIITIQNPIPPTDPRKQHDETIAKVQAGEYGDYSDK
ncbi:MAG TPA: hypothetical protein VIJ28_13885 [Chloroflexota bacterium]|jgi:hypothetical protein